MYKLYRNIYYYLRIKLLYNKYCKWVFDDEKNDIAYYKNEFVNILKLSNVKDCKLPITMPTGYGMVINSRVSVFANFPSKYSDHVYITLQSFETSIGEYKKRIFETFNPLYWIENILFLPKSILSYLGFEKDALPNKIIKIVFTPIWWVICVIIAYFKQDILILISNLINSIINGG